MTKNLGECVHGLAGKIAQVIMVTYKSQADADWSISLGYHVDASKPRTNVCTWQNRTCEPEIAMGRMHMLND